MARPVKADAQATRRRILERAQELFSERGLDGASVRDIARASGVSLAMVHHYFGSKDELYSACIDSMYAELSELREPFLETLAGGGASAELCELAVITGYRFAREHRTAFRLLMRAVIEAGELDERRRTTVQAPFLDTSSTAVGAMLGRPPETLRFSIHTIVLLVARYAISSDVEFELLSGARGEEAHRAVERHLVHTTLALLGLTPAAPSEEGGSPKDS